MEWDYISRRGSITSFASLILCASVSLVVSGAGPGNMPGYEVKPTKEVDKAFECPVCLVILREPVQVTPCGHRVCKSCLEPILRWAKMQNKQLNTADIKWNRIEIEFVIGGIHFHCVRVYLWQNIDRLTFDKALWYEWKIWKISGWTIVLIWSI